MRRVEDILAEDIARRARLFLSEPGKPFDQAPFMRVIAAGDAAVQQVAGVVLALLIVVSAARRDVEPDRKIKRHPLGEC